MANNKAQQIVMRALMDKYTGAATSRLTISTPVDFQRQPKQQQNRHIFSNLSFNQTAQQQQRSLITNKASASSAITPNTDSFPNQSYYHQ